MKKERICKNPDEKLGKLPDEELDQVAGGIGYSHTWYESGTYPVYHAGQRIEYESDNTKGIFYRGNIIDLRRTEDGTYLKKGDFYKEFIYVVRRDNGYIDNEVWEGQITYSEMY